MTCTNSKIHRTFWAKKNCFSNKPLVSRRKLYSAWTKVVNSFVSVFAWPIARVVCLLLDSQSFESSSHKQVFVVAALSTKLWLSFFGVIPPFILLHLFIRHSSSKNTNYYLSRILNWSDQHPAQYIDKTRPNYQILESFFFCLYQIFKKGAVRIEKKTNFTFISFCTSCNFNK